MLPQPGCCFCLDNELLANAPLFANATCYFFESVDPILPHAGMIIPFRHIGEPFALDSAEWSDVFDLLQHARTHLSAAMPDGYTIGWNVGPVAGQTVPHAHLHIIARFADEPLAGQGLRHHIKQASNRRASLKVDAGNNP